MRILVLGGTGFIGAPLVQHLIRDRHTVAVFHRGDATANLPDSIRHVYGNRNRLHEARSDFAAFAPQVVVDLIAYTEAQAEAAADLFAGLADRAIVISSGDVYRNYDGLRGAHAQAPDPAPLAEDAPLRESHHPYRDYADRENERLYNYDKILVENAYQSADALPCTVLRLPAVYGPNDRQRRLFPYLKRMDDERPAVLISTAQANWRWTRGYVENVAAAIALTIRDERAAGRIYNVGSAKNPTETEWIRRIAAAADWDGEIITMPADQLPEHLRPELDYTYDLALDTSRIRQELGYQELVSPNAAMERTVTWTHTHPPESVDETAFDYDAEDQVLKMRSQ